MGVEKEKRRLALNNVLAVNEMLGWESELWFVDLMNEYVEGRRTLESIMDQLTQEAIENKGFSTCRRPA